ncbi:hypothetical protein DFQ30_008913 [Apophysomyces sp. BC1015]|nr:hypothetical protein DFQ30_008913 [Apophysomyces sp. BC1015]
MESASDMFHRNIIRTNGVNIEFIFKKYKAPFDPKRKALTPADIKDKYHDAVIWGVDPGVSSLFVATDGVGDTPHRVCTTTTKEYYSLCGFNHATRVRNSYLAKEPETKAIIDKTPSLKTVDLGELTKAISYIFVHYDMITSFYDHDLRYTAGLAISLYQQLYIKI